MIGSAITDSILVIAKNTLPGPDSICFYDISPCDILLAGKNISPCDILLARKRSSWISCLWRIPSINTGAYYGNRDQEHSTSKSLLEQNWYVQEPIEDIEFNSFGFSMIKLINENQIHPLNMFPSVTGVEKMSSPHIKWDVERSLRMRALF